MKFLKNFNSLFTNNEKNYIRHLRHCDNGEKILNSQFSILNSKVAFSLAEAMVMLVIIAIVMAMAAPLIVHKANADSKRLIFLGSNSNIATAMGGNQNFGVGTRNPSDAKLTVNATNNSQNLIAKFVSNFVVDSGSLDQKATKAKKVIFQVLPKAGDAYVTANGNPNGFQVYADGTTNAACMPDFTNKITIFEGVSPTQTPDTALCAPENAPCYSLETKKKGYILSSRSIRLYTSKTGSDWNTSTQRIFHPNLVPYEFYPCKVKLLDGVQGCVPSVKIFTYMGELLIPVNKGSYVTLYYGNSAKEEDSDKMERQMVDGINKGYFIPCTTD